MSDQNDFPFSPFAETLGSRLEQFLENGWRLPITGFAVDEFGNFMSSRFIKRGDSAESRFIAEHLETGGMIAPFPIVHLDGTPGHVDCFDYGTPPRRAN
jgi:hypothetical protein